MPQRRLRTFNQCLTDIGDTESSLVRRGDVVVDDRGEVDRNIVLGHADLLWNLNNLDLDIHLNQFLRQRVDLDKTRVDCSIESAKLGDKTDVALADWLVGIRANDAARDGSKETEA